MPTANAVYGSGHLAEQLGIPKWKVRYLLDRGDLPGPSLVLPGRRLFTGEDIEAIKKVYAEREAEKGDVSAAA